MLDLRQETLVPGYRILPKGMMANAVFYLERFVEPNSTSARTRPALARAAPGGFRLEPLTGKDHARFMKLFRLCGEDWLWSGYLELSEAEMIALLEDPSMQFAALVSPQGDIGVTVLDFRIEGEAEIVYFGLVAKAVGHGIGRWLMLKTLDAIATQPVKRIWLHSCNFDHPKAIRFYKNAGFTIYASGYEIIEDPRVKGLLPVTAAKHVPMVG